VNVTDEDGDTPLYTVENLDTARFLVEHGAAADRRNNDGVSPAEHLAEDFPEVASFLLSVLPVAPSVPSVALQAQPSLHQQDVASEQLTSELMRSVQEIMVRAEADGHDPEEELRQVVGRTVLEGVITGYGMSTEEEERREEDHRDGDGAVNGVKRRKT